MSSKSLSLLCLHYYAHVRHNVVMCTPGYGIDQHLRKDAEGISVNKNSIV